MKATQNRDFSPTTTTMATFACDWDSSRQSYSPTFHNRSYSDAAVAAASDLDTVVVAVACLHGDSGYNKLDDGADDAPPPLPHDGGVNARARRSLLAIAVIDVLGVDI